MPATSYMLRTFASCFSEMSSSTRPAGQTHTCIALSEEQHSTLQNTAHRQCKYHYSIILPPTQITPHLNAAQHSAHYTTSHHTTTYDTFSPHHTSPDLTTSQHTTPHYLLHDSSLHHIQHIMPHHTMTSHGLWPWTKTTSSPKGCEGSWAGWGSCFKY